jgi:hypothetical protein
MTLAEDFLLLAMHEEKVKPVIPVLRVECGLVGAVLAELVVAGRIGFEGRKGDEIVVLDPTPLGTPEEDAVLARIVEEKPRRTQWWFNKLKSQLRQRTVERLVASGILAEERHSLLGFIPVTGRRPERHAAGDRPGVRPQPRGLPGARQEGVQAPRRGARRGRRGRRGRQEDDRADRGGDGRPHGGGHRGSRRRRRVSGPAPELTPRECASR